MKKLIISAEEFEQGLIIELGPFTSSNKPNIETVHETVDGERTITITIGDK